MPTETIEARLIIAVAPAGQKNMRFIGVILADAHTQMTLFLWVQKHIAREAKGVLRFKPAPPELGG